jgi:hypothetical protein
VRVTSYVPKTDRVEVLGLEQAKANLEGLLSTAQLWDLDNWPSSKVKVLDYKIGIAGEIRSTSEERKVRISPRRVSITCGARRPVRFPNLLGSSPPSWEPLRCRVGFSFRGVERVAVYRQWGLTGVGVHTWNPSRTAWIWFPNPNLAQRCADLLESLRRPSAWRKRRRTTGEGKAPTGSTGASRRTGVWLSR